MSRTRLILALPLVALASACTTTGQGAKTPITQAAAPGGPARADVNPSYKVGQVAAPSVPVLSLEQMQEVVARAKPLDTLRAEDKLFGPAMRNEAMSFGARGGLAWASKQINEMLEAQADKLTRTYDFNSFLIKAQGGVTLLPPVIVESRDTYEQSDAGKTLRVADTYYEIIEQARFAPVAPLWHTYLFRQYTAPEAPSDKVLPMNDGERDLWKKFVAEGWAQGVRQAQDIFRNDLRRLERDFTGMVRYSELLEKNLVTAPIVADANLGVTGTGQDMRINDRTLRITADPRLNVQTPDQWRAPVSGTAPIDAATPPGGVPGLNPAKSH